MVFLQRPRLIMRVCVAITLVSVGTRLGTNAKRKKWLSWYSMIQHGTPYLIATFRSTFPERLAWLIEEKCFWVTFSSEDTCRSRVSLPVLSSSGDLVAVDEQPASWWETFKTALTWSGTGGGVGVLCIGMWLLQEWGLESGRSDKICLVESWT